METKDEQSVGEDEVVGMVVVLGVGVDALVGVVAVVDVGVVVGMDVDVGVVVGVDVDVDVGVGVVEGVVEDVGVAGGPELKSSCHHSHFFPCLECASDRGFQLYGKHAQCSYECT